MDNNGTTRDAATGGGNVNAVERVGATVRRSAGPWTPTVHRLLDHLHNRGVTFVPRALGMDADDREILSWMEGETAGWPIPAWVWEAGTRHRAGRMLRDLHDASTDFPLEGAHWRMPAHHPIEVICLNDVAPYNMVHDGDRLVGIIDVDMASPGPRVWDLAYLAYRLCGWCEDSPAPGDRSPHVLLDDLLDAYGRDAAPPATDVLATMRERLLELADWTHEHARATGAAELDAHAQMYRRDASRLTPR
ncbi:aminoglycoside phosphotransferase family protein [Demequina globuliformis]|uniref:aminoglycoside phosphotransferase family protein n=1 Tax=Demequina globuliformis TaxID=676202 RepID=UPI0007827C2F|nr:aminoglycoside phosphotransferase family protein [Demequina globuliformis]